MTTTTTKAKGIPVAIPSTGASVTLNKRAKNHKALLDIIADYRVARDAAATQKALGQDLRNLLVVLGVRRVESADGSVLVGLKDNTKAVVDVEAMRSAHPAVVEAYEQAQAAYDALAKDYTVRVFSHDSIFVA